MTLHPAPRERVHRPRAPRHGLLTWVVLVAALASNVAAAQPAWVQPNRSPGFYTLGELAVLPDYCKDVHGTYYGDANDPSPRAGYWVGLMGKDFWHTHHYCRAMALERRASNVGLRPVERSVMRLKAVDDYEYMLGVCARTNPLLPEILLRYGELLLTMNNMPKAKEMFESARVLKPDYWPAYTRWIDVQKGLKMYDHALTLAREGLQHAPGQPELMRREAELARIRGAGPAPRPAQTAAAQAAPVSQP